MTNKTYDILKFLALIATPIITFLCAIVSIWGIPYGQQITATLAALDTLIGAIVAIAKIQYDKKNKVGDANGNEANGS